MRQEAKEGEERKDAERKRNATKTNEGPANGARERESNVSAKDRVREDASVKAQKLKSPALDENKTAPTLPHMNKYEQVND